MVPDWLAPDLGNGFGLNRIVNDLGGTLAPVDRQRTVLRSSSKCPVMLSGRLWPSILSLHNALILFRIQFLW